MAMTDDEIIKNLLEANRLAEATLLRLTIVGERERAWAIEALDRLGKSQADAEWQRRAA